MLKEVSQPFQIVCSASVTGISTFTSSVSNILYKDVVVYQTVWTGAPVGYVEIRGSLDYSPGYPQGVGGINAGSWTSIASVAMSTSQPIVFNLRQLGLAWTQVQFVISSGTGVFGTHFAAKSF